MTKGELRRGVAWAAGATAILFLVNIALFLSSPPQYVCRATVKLMGFEAYPSGASEDFSRLVFEMVENFADSFLGDSVLSGVAAKLGMQPDASEEIKSMIRTRPILGSTSVTLSIINRNPETARRIALAFLEVRANMHEESVRRRLAEKVEAMLEMEHKVKAELDQEVGRLSPAQPSAYVAGRIRAIDAALPQIVIERARVEGELHSFLAMAKAGILGDTPDDPTEASYVASSQSSRKWGVVELRRELLDSRTALAAISVRNGERNPTTESAKARVKAAEKELKGYLEVQIDKQRAGLEALERNETQLKEARAEFENTMKAYLLADLTEGTRRAAIAGLETSLASIVEARHTSELNQAFISPLFIVLAPPALPVAPERPRTRLSFLACPLLGAIIGLLGLTQKRS